MDFPGYSLAPRMNSPGSHSSSHIVHTSSVATSLPAFSWLYWCTELQVREKLSSGSSNAFMLRYCSHQQNNITSIKVHDRNNSQKHDYEKREKEIHQQLQLFLQHKIRSSFRKRGSTIVAPDESITILVLQLTVYILLCLLHGDVHVTIQAGQDTYKCDSQ